MPPFEKTYRFSSSLLLVIVSEWQEPGSPIGGWRSLSLRAVGCVTGWGRWRPGGPLRRWALELLAVGVSFVDGFFGCGELFLVGWFCSGRGGFYRVWVGTLSNLHVCRGVGAVGGVSGGGGGCGATAVAAGYGCGRRSFPAGEWRGVLGHVSAAGRFGRTAGV